VVITLWVDYRSHAQAASQLEKLVRAEVEALGHTSFGHCVLRQLGERGLQYELEFQVNSANYGLLLRHQDQLLTRLLNKCPQQGIELVMPAAVQPVTLVKGEQGAKK
jgi:2-polyprenyl-6-methoxyphenol hydroxylase-like FAD-dependent oxidoreductase